MWEHSFDATMINLLNLPLHGLQLLVNTKKSKEKTPSVGFFYKDQNSVYEKYAQTNYIYKQCRSKNLTKNNKGHRT